MTTAVSSDELNVAPGSIVVVRAKSGWSSPRTSTPTVGSARLVASLKGVGHQRVLLGHGGDRRAPNRTNIGTQNYGLARVLAPTTESAILACATPHNGKESLAELLRLLDPTAVMANGTYPKDDVDSLLIRRHRYHPEGAAEVGSDAERAEPVYSDSLERTVAGPELAHHRHDREGLRRRNPLFLRGRAITKLLSAPGGIPQHHRRRAVRLMWPAPGAIRTMFDSEPSPGPDRSPTPVRVEA